MEQHFYIGTSEIIFHVDQELHLEHFDSLFLQPVLPSETFIYIDLKWVDTLEAQPKKVANSETPHFLAWQSKDGERRLYLRWKKEPLLASHLLPSKDRVFITALRDHRDEIMKTFRPWFQIHLERLLLSNNALILHSASIIYHGEALLFSAPSGTGKTTHTDLWHKYINGVSDLNGDQTVLQKTEDGWLACGYPIYGSMVRCAQAAVPIRAIIILRQAETDTVRELSPTEKLVCLYNECTVMVDYPEDVKDALKLLEEMLPEVTVIGLDCTMERSAVNVLYEYLYNK